MKFEEILPALREGKKITNRIIRLSGYKYIFYKDGTVFEDKGGYWHLASGEVVDNDNWEIVEEKKKVKLRDLITQEQLEKWKERNCEGIKCKDCAFRRGDKCIYVAYALVEDKSILSDKFLDQEIEIEEE